MNEGEEIVTRSLEAGSPSVWNGFTLGHAGNGIEARIGDLDQDVFSASGASSTLGAVATLLGTCPNCGPAPAVRSKGFGSWYENTNGNAYVSWESWGDYSSESKYFCASCGSGKISRESFYCCSADGARRRGGLVGKLRNYCCA